MDGHLLGTGQAAVVRPDVPHIFKTVCIHTFYYIYKNNWRQKDSPFFIFAITGGIKSRQVCETPVRGFLRRNARIQLQKGGREVGSLSIQLTEDAESLLNRVGEMAESLGIQCQHDGQSGSFSHMGVSGTFTVKGNLLTIEYSKPALLAESVVEYQIRQIFE
jgi:hypothetical protein